MPEDRARLLAALEQLHDQLAAAEPLDEQVRQRLQQVLDDIQQALEAGAAATPEQPSAAPAAQDRGSLVDRLSETARHFEETHPTLSGAVGSVIDALSRMGI